MVQTVILLRSYTLNVTLGVLFARSKKFYTLELPWRNNQSNISCIPPGEYRAKFVERSASGRYHNVYHVQDVPGRGGILIHSGNITAHSKGCLLIGRKPGLLGDQPAVLNSKSALAEFVSLMQPHDFRLIIMGEPQ